MKKYFKLTDIIILIISLASFAAVFYLFGAYIYKFRLTHLLLNGAGIIIIVLAAIYVLLNVSMKRKALRLIVKLIVSMLITFVISTLYVQDTMVFTGYYNQDLVFTEEEDTAAADELFADEKVETFAIRNKGAELKGWMKISDNPLSPTIICYNGNCGFANINFDLFSNISEDYNILLVDYRGFGNSTGIPNHRNTKSDALAITDYVLEDSEYSQNGVYILGYSIGTELASYAAEHRDVQGLILIAPFNDLVNVYNEYSDGMFQGPLEYLIKYKFAPAEHIKNINEDTLIITSDDDGMFSVEMAEDILNNAQGNAELIVLDGVEHNDYLTEDYRDVTNGYINGFIQSTMK